MAPRAAGKDLDSMRRLSRGRRRMFYRRSKEPPWRPAGVDPNGRFLGVKLHMSFK
jgi:hypothetical protein